MTSIQDESVVDSDTAKFEGEVCKAFARTVTIEDLKVTITLMKTSRISMNVVKNNVKKIYSG